MLKPKASPLTFPRLLLTGAAGQLGQELRPRLKNYCDVLRVSDQKNLGEAQTGEEIQITDLANASFNRITIDGDTSTNDSFMVMATRKATHAVISDWHSADGQTLRAALLSVAQHLAHAIVRDGEGATKFITIRVEGGKTSEECRLAAYAIAHSPLVKTAFFASDPNLGRILAAVGYAGIRP